MCHPVRDKCVSLTHTRADTRTHIHTCAETCPAMERDSRSLTAGLNVPIRRLQHGYVRGCARKHTHTHTSRNFRTQRDHGDLVSRLYRFLKFPAKKETDHRLKEEWIHLLHKCWMQLLQETHTHRNQMMSLKGCMRRGVRQAQNTPFKNALTITYKWKPLPMHLSSLTKPLSVA